MINKRFQRTVDGMPIKHELPGKRKAGWAQVDKALASVPFNNWRKKLDRVRFVIESVTIQSIDMFGPERVGFNKIVAKVFDTAGHKLSGVALLRGGSVAIVVVLVCEGKRYAVLTVQPRLPTGSFGFVEVPAGMLDGDGNFAGVAAKEIGEELGIKITEKDLVPLGDFKDGVFVSPGFTDEVIHFFSYTREVTPEFIADLRGRLTGEIAEGELITVDVIPFDQLATIGDMKTLTGYLLYNMHVLSPNGRISPA